MSTLSGKGAIVTGGGTGVGKAAALRLAKEGCHVVINYSRSSLRASAGFEHSSVCSSPHPWSSSTPVRLRGCTRSRITTTVLRSTRSRTCRVYGTSPVCGPPDPGLLHRVAHFAVAPARDFPLLFFRRAVEERRVFPIALRCELARGNEVQRR